MHIFPIKAVARLEKLDNCNYKNKNHVEKHQNLPSNIIIQDADERQMKGKPEQNSCKQLYKNAEQTA